MNGKIKAIREKAGMTQAELARRAGVDRSYLSKIENGKQKPSFAFVERIAAVLNVSMKDFF